jgi:hypothetical protein
MQVHSVSLTTSHVLALKTMLQNVPYSCLQQGHCCHGADNGCKTLSRHQSTTATAASQYIKPYLCNTTDPTHQNHPTNPQPHPPWTYPHTQTPSPTRSNSRSNLWCVQPPQQPLYLTPLSHLNGPAVLSHGSGKARGTRLG